MTVVAMSRAERCVCRGPRRLEGGRVMFCQAVRGWAPADVGATMTEVAVSSAVTFLRALRVYSTLTDIMCLGDAAV